MSLLTTVFVFLIAVPWGDTLIRHLRAWGIGKRIREDGPQSHHAKWGTPTMGGVMIATPIALVLIGFIVLGHIEMWPPLFTLVAYGVLGAFDDLIGLRDEQGVGWLARYKFPWQLSIGLVVAVILYYGLGLQSARIPGTGLVWQLGWAYIPVAAFIIVGTVNAVNLTDGLDGLAGGTAAIAFGAYGAIAGWEYLGQGHSPASSVDQGILAMLAFALVGAISAFLWYNVYPARLFMGETGSLMLGGLLATIALMSEWWLLLPLIGIVFVAETVSVILQVGYFKYTKRRYGTGRRIFRMAPLHHHFELGGWPEVRVTLRFWLVGLMAALLGIVIVLL